MDRGWRAAAIRVAGSARTGGAASSQELGRSRPRLEGVDILLPVLLLIGAAFNVLTWPTFLRRVAKDPRARDERGRATRFLTVHIVLVIIALTIASTSAVAAVIALATGG